jgi:hypothetical protein
MPGGEHHGQHRNACPDRHRGPDGRSVRGEERQRRGCVVQGVLLLAASMNSVNSPTRPRPARTPTSPAKLVDVEPDGYCANIAEGSIRARYRSGEAREELLEPGEVTEFSIDLWDVAHTFRAGHRIRIEISSSNFPRFDRNLNTAVSPALAGPGELQVADQQVWHDADHPSQLTLPLVDQTGG